MRKTSFGFTMIEILVVVAVIGILSTIGVVAFTKVQTDSRDSQRSSRVTVISEALEKYYQQNGEYPSCAQMKQDPSIIKSSVLKGIDTSVLVTPTDKTNDNSITTCDNLTSGPGSDVYAYVGDGSPDCMTGSSCLSYSLKYREESTGDIISVDSRHSTDIATSGASVLTATSTGFNQVSLSWTSVLNASTYDLRRTSNSTCTNVTKTINNITNTSYVDSGLSAGTTYYYLVRGKTNGVGGTWSNCTSVTTQALSGVGCVATADSNSQITLTWTRDSSATTYDIDYSPNSNFSSPVYAIHGIAQVPSGNTPTQVVTGLSTGVQYFFRCQAVAGTVHGPWSYDSAVTYVPSPTSLTATTNSATQITANWSDVSVATSYSLDYSTTSNFTPATTNQITGITGLSQVITSLKQGVTYYLRVFAVVGTTPSEASPTANSTTSVNSPGAPGMAASQPGAIRTCAAGYWVKYPQYCPNNYYATGWVTSASCPSGTYAVYQLYARYNSPTTAYYSSASTASQWYFEAASGGYYTLWGGRYYCQGPNAASSWGPWSGEARS